MIANTHRFNMTFAKSLKSSIAVGCGGGGVPIRPLPNLGEERQICTAFVNLGWNI